MNATKNLYFLFQAISPLNNLSIYCSCVSHQNAARPKTTSPFKWSIINQFVNYPSPWNRYLSASSQNNQFPRLVFHFPFIIDECLSLNIQIAWSGSWLPCYKTCKIDMTPFASWGQHNLSALWFLYWVNRSLLLTERLFFFLLITSCLYRRFYQYLLSFGKSVTEHTFP